MQHVDVAKRHSSRRDLEKRLTGRFYTPNQIAERLVEHALTTRRDPEVVCDPFCGDGRLVVAWIRAAAQRSGLRRLRKVVLWDFDAAAVGLAVAAVRGVLSSVGLRRPVDVVAESGDTFLRALAEVATMDTLLTNPPWELLKPDVRDGLDDDSAYKGSLRAYASSLAVAYPGALSARGKALTGYGVNLARAGAIASTLLTRAGGALAIVLPSSIFADQASAPFRQEFLSKVALRNLDWYPAEARAFEGIDQPFVVAAGVAGRETTTFTLTRHTNSLDVLDQRSSRCTDLCAPVPLNVAGDQAELVTQLASKNTALSGLETDMRFGLWLGRELDETRLHDSLGDASRGVPFLKGRHVFPFRIVRDETLYVDPARRPIPSTVSLPRLAWRDVSRPTQRRRMHVARVPAGNVTGNSLGVAYFRYGPIKWIDTLMAIMNSFTFELQMRARLATAHVSQGVLRDCYAPLRCFEDPILADRLQRLVQARLATDEECVELEVCLARAYGLTRGEFACVLEGFPKITEDERDRYLRDELWR